MDAIEHNQLQNLMMSAMISSRVAAFGLIYIT